MNRRTIFVPYRPKTILNKGKRADHWFWTRYSAYPYIGCQHGCKFCYCREEKYAPYADIADFEHVIKVKENAPDLLRKALQRAPVDVVFTGDYQPAEKKFGVSREMLSICLELGFPVFVLERSPLVLRDLDLLQAIEKRARTVVAFSIIYTPESPEATSLRYIENLAPPPEKRFAAMRQIAAAGILTGTCFMPILPGLCDRKANLEAVVRWTAEYGGKFVLPGGLTLSDQQRQYFFEVLTGRLPEYVARYQAFYPPGSYGPAGWPWLNLAQRIRELCARYGIADRIPRPVIPGEKRALNKRIVEQLANQLYARELQGESGLNLWSLRKAAFAVEDLEQDIRLVYRQMGRKGLESLPGVGPGMGKVIEELLLELSSTPFHAQA